MTNINRLKFIFQNIITVTVMITLLTMSRQGALAQDEFQKSIPERSLKKTRELLDLKMSDVLLSSRWRHPSGKNDPQSTEKAIADFFATRMEWSYFFERDFIDQCRSQGIRCFQGTVNTMFQTGKKYAEKAIPGHETSQEGKPVTGPWMIPISTWWGCVNTPEYRKDYIVKLQKMLDAGVNSIQMDDPGLNWTAVQWGACYCDRCFDGFNRFLQKNATSPLNHGYHSLTRKEFHDPVIMKKLRPLFENFQKESVLNFYIEMKKQIAKLSGREIPFSSNNYGGRWTFPYYLFDFGCSEVGKKSISPKGLLAIQQTAHSQGHVQYITLALRNLQLNRAVFAATYAAGGHMILPWDVYIPPTLSPRLYLDPKDFADLPGFVRATAPILDSCLGESQGLGFTFQENHPAGISVFNKNSKMALFVRITDNPIINAQSKKESFKGKRTVIHLVDWCEVPDKINETEEAPGEKTGILPTPTTIVFDKSITFGQTPEHVVFLKPASYDSGLHEKTKKDGDYSRLAQKTVLAVRWKNEKGHITVPPVAPWGILILDEENHLPLK